MFTSASYFSNLRAYLSNAPFLATVQFVVFAVVLYVLIDGCWRALASARNGLSPHKISGPLLEDLSRLCAGLGLLLTFAGLYAYIASEGPRDRWSLRLALGSSAIGYSAFTLCALGAVIDAVLRAYRKESEEEPNDDFEVNDDVIGERRHLGGLADHADRPAAATLGSLDSYQRRDWPGPDHDDRADPDLAEEEWSDGFLPEPEPPNTLGPDLPPLGNNGQTRPDQDD